MSIASLFRHLVWPIALSMVPSCYLDWDEITYQPICDPLSPNTTCSSLQMRCKPQAEGDPICEGPVGKPNQNGFCLSDEACGSTELCLAPHDGLPSKICLQLCLEASDCPTGYSCKKGYPMAARGEAWGACVQFPPPAWSCDPAYYAGWSGGEDNQCDCGCGVFDPDCPDESNESCDRCWNESKDLCVPEQWTCSITQYNDKNCDCGCGVIDPDCDDNTRSSCQNCPEGSCGYLECSGTYDPILPDDNAHCKEMPKSWKCDLKSYFDGQNCDCGCNVTDPDCGGPGNTYCGGTCPTGSCGFPDCSQDLFHPNDNSQCVASPSED